MLARGRSVTQWWVASLVSLASFTCLGAGEQPIGAPLVIPAAGPTVLVRFSEIRVDDQFDQRLAMVDLERVTTFRATHLPGLVLARPRAGASISQALAALRSSSGVLYAERDPAVINAALRPNDPRYLDQFNLENTGQDGGTVGGDIEGPQAWETSRCSPAQVIGIVDTGIELSHQDLAGRLWVNPGEIASNGLDDDGNGYVDDVHGWNARDHNGNVNDTHGHGTAVAGIAGAATDNALGIAGVCWDVRLMALMHSGPDVLPTASSVIELIDYAITQKERGVDIVALNMSLLVVDFSQAFEDALAAAGNVGILVAAAAGNSNLHLEVMPLQPAASDLPNVITVAATDRFDNRADFSNFGRFTVDVAAPGKEVPTSGLANVYGPCSGTSCATPHIAAALAMLRQRFPSATPQQLKSRLIHSAEPVAALAGVVANGARLNLRRALAGSVSVATVEFDDVDPVRGNGDRFLDPGETGSLIIALDNLAATSMGPVELIVRDPPAGVTILDNYARLESIDGSTSTTLSLPVSFALAEATSCTGAITFDVELRVAGQPPVRNVISLPIGHDVVSTLLDDDFESDRGWTYPTPSATDGSWQRVDPVGTVGAFGFVAQPENDVGPDPEVTCQVTKNGLPGGAAGAADVDGGSVFLRSPRVGDANSRSMSMFWHGWFYSSNTAADDSYEMALSVDGGSQWRSVLRVADDQARVGGWTLIMSNLSNLIGTDSAANLAVRVEVRDGPLDAGVVEGALDDVLIRSVREECRSFSPATRQPPNPVGNTLQVRKLSSHVSFNWQAPPSDATHDAPTRYTIHESLLPSGGFSVVGQSTDLEHVAVDGALGTSTTYYLVEAQ